MSQFLMPVIFSEEFLQHHTGAYHPESPVRLTAIREHLRQIENNLLWRSPTPIAQRPDLLQWITKVHTPSYVAQVQHIAQNGGGRMDSDTYISPHSYTVALLAVSAWLDGIDQVLASGRPVFALTRPPGHHALPDRTMGFCIFGNAAIAGFYALAQSGIKRVAIIDWDVHHGNGTQSAVWYCPDIAYISTHQAPYYPGTGWQTERGGQDNVRNFPMPAGSGSVEYRQVFQQEIIPFLRHWQADVLIVSAGFDANRNDPLAQMQLQPSDYGTFTEMLLAITPKILFGLEGGYDLPSLSESVLQVIQTCLTRISGE
jgi:acetoin utilization deacetylase AcuC-like enzyme